MKVHARKPSRQQVMELRLQLDAKVLGIPRQAFLDDRRHRTGARTVLEHQFAFFDLLERADQSTRQEPRTWQYRTDRRRVLQEVREEAKAISHRATLCRRGL